MGDWTLYIIGLISDVPLVLDYGLVKNLELSKFATASFWLSKLAW
jgi:hypothetical protein